MRKFSVILAYIGIVIVCIVLTTATYAYVNDDGEVNDIVMEPTVELLHVDYEDTSNISMFNARFGDTFKKVFSVTNVSGKDMYYDINLISVANNFVYPEDLVYTLSSDSGAYTSVNQAPVSDEVIAKRVKIEKDTKHDYVLNVSFIKKNTDQFENELKTFFAKVNVSASDFVTNYGENSLYKTIETVAMGSEKNIDFNTNYYEGVFRTNASINGATIFFYRGSNLLKNNILLGNNCYKIIRTTESGDVKAIFAGESTNGYCIEDAVDVVERLSLYNNSSNSNAYVGYMYGNVNSESYDDEHKNTASSVIKIYLDSWYNKNLKDYSDFVSNSVIYCANRKTSVFDYNKMKLGSEGFAGNNTGYEMMNKYYNTGLVNFDCYNVNDRFSVYNVSGNNKLANSIGLISVEELYYSGYLSGSDNTNHYLYSIYPYWTMTPAYFNNGNAYNFVVNKNNLIQSKVDNDYAIRPVISLKGDLNVISGDGSITSPYILSK